MRREIEIKQIDDDLTLFLCDGQEVGTIQWGGTCDDEYDRNTRESDIKYWIEAGLNFSPSFDETIKEAIRRLEVGPPAKEDEWARFRHIE